MIRVRIEPSRGTMLAEDKDDAQALRRDVILPALERDEEVELDFGTVGTATQSYVHALISEAIRRYGDATYELLHFKSCSDEVRQIVLTVFEYTHAASDAAYAEREVASSDPKT